jgi:hemolysin activation/secretion protein
LLLVFAGSSQAMAQGVPAQPRVDLKQTEKKFDNLQAERKRTEKPAIRLPSAPAPALTPDSRPMFKLTAVSVVGASALPEEVIAETYRSSIGTTVSAADLAGIAGKISDLYRAAGYHLSRAIVPPQDAAGGRVRIQVIEGAVTEIVLKGERAEQFGVRALLAPIAAERPSRLATLERQLLLANERPGVRLADTAVEEIGVASGRFRLIVYLETWRIYTSVGLDNRGTRDVGPWQAYWSTAFNSYLIPGDTLAVNLSTIPDATQELGFSRLLYEVPVGTSGVRLGATASYGEIWPGDERREINSHTRTETYELRGSIAPLLTRRTSLWLTAAAGYTDAVDADSFGMNYRDHIRMVSLTADYQLQDDLNGWNYLTVTFRQGINVLGASQRDDGFLSRGDGSGSFSKLEFAYTRYQKLTDIWSLKFAAAGQWASTAMLASQEFYLGGPGFGRGYSSGEVSGDNGIAASLELRFDQKLQSEVFKGYQLYGFVDRGVVWDFRNGPDDRLTLSSLGAGARLYMAGELEAGIEVAAPLDWTAGNEERKPHLFFSVSKSFKFCPGSIHMHCG